MSVRLTDAEIDFLVQEEKPLPGEYRAKLSRLAQKQQHRKAALELATEAGNRYRIMLRQNVIDQFNFSAILAYLLPGTNQVFRLRRYNGNNHEHTNAIEGELIAGFHIHQATERYQAAGFDEDGFAVQASGYESLYSALAQLLKDCSCIPPDEGDGQSPLFPGGWQLWH